MNGAKFLKTNIFCNKCNCGFETLLVAIWGCVTYDFADRTGLTQRKEGAELKFSALLRLPKYFYFSELFSSPIFSIRALVSGLWPRKFT